MSFSENLQFLRSHHQITQEQLAEQLGVSRQSVSKWENNFAVPELDKLIKMSEIFSVTIDELVGRKQTSDPVPPAQDIVVQPGMPPRRIAGTILLCFGLIAFLILTLMGGFFLALLFCGPFVIVGSILLTCNTNLVLKTFWLTFSIYSPLSIFILINFIGYGRVIALVTTIVWFAILILGTLLLQRHNRVTATTKKLAVVSVILSLALSIMLHIGTGIMYRYSGLHTATEEFVTSIEES